MPIMSEGLDETTLEERLQSMLEILDEDDLRHQAICASMALRAAWIDLAELLHEIADEEAFKEWGFRSPFSYCASELNLSRSTAEKLLEGFRWIQMEAPEYLPRNQQDGVTLPVPELDTAAAMARGLREMEDDRLSAETYARLKEKALRNGESGRRLAKEIRESIPEHLRDDPEPNPFKHLKRALSEVEKALEQIDQHDSSLLERASQVRDGIFELVTLKATEEA
jgi:hypothetical protein